MGINVLGQIRIPGRILLPKGANILDALAAAGGQTDWSNLSKVLIIHRSEGKPDTATIDLRQILAGAAPNIVLHDGDTINVPKLTVKF